MSEYRLITTAADRYAIHQDLARHFEHQDVGRVQFAEAPSDGTRRTVMVRTERPSSGDVGWMPVSPPALNDDGLLAAGARFRFVIEFNPVKAAILPEQLRGRGKRVGITRPEEAGDWLRARLEASGFVVDARLSVQNLPSLSLRKPAGGHPMVFVRHRAAGVVEISDTALATALYRGGIGKGRAFGLGMLVLLPSSTAP